uniref:Uncharacterized protein n=1 Tax=Oryza meridionalis TaxID=40149 RepID=A0A0E0EI94_9ORYZ
MALAISRSAACLMRRAPLLRLSSQADRRSALLPTQIARFKSEFLGPTTDGVRVAQAVRDSEMNTEDILLVQKALNKKLTHEKCLSDVSMLEDGVKVARIWTSKEKINKSPDKKSFTLQMDYINFGSILYASVVVTAYILERKDELARQKKL